MRSLKKTDIAKLAMQFMSWLNERHLSEDVRIYFNNQVVYYELVKDNDKKEWISELKIEENVSPMNYFECVNPKHILSMSFEGALHTELNYGNGRFENKMQQFFKKYGLYFELGDTWNLSVYPIDEELYEQIEYTSYEKGIKGKPKEIGLKSTDVLPELKQIMGFWFDESAKVGDVGSCVIGSGIEFEYKGSTYFMDAMSPYQGSMSWETPLPKVMSKLEEIGAVNVKYCAGMMD